MWRVLFLSAGLLAACAPRPDPRFPDGQELYLFFDSGLDRAPFQFRVARCSFDMCLESATDRVELVRVAGGWRGALQGQPLAIFDNGSGLWGAAPIDAIRMTWKSPPQS